MEEILLIGDLERNIAQTKMNIAIFYVTIALWLISIVVILIFVRTKHEGDKKVARVAQELKRITDSVHAGIVNFHIEKGMKIIYASNGFYDVLGYTKEQISNQFHNELEGLLLHKEDLESDSVKIEEGSCIKKQVQVHTADGVLRYLWLEGRLSKNKNGKYTVSAVLVDVTESKEMQEKLILEEERYRVAEELSNDVLFEYDVEQDVLKFSNKYTRIFHKEMVKPAFLKNLETYLQGVHPDDRETCAEYCRILYNFKDKVTETQFRIGYGGDKYIWCRMIARSITMQNGNKACVIGKMSNIDNYKREVERLESMAMRDALTGVYNKISTASVICKYMEEHREGTHVLLMIDIDDFKKINDKYGHMKGDSVLTKVIDEIIRIFPKDIIGRIGGDEFVVFLGNIESMEKIICVARELQERLRVNYTEDNTHINATASIGLAIYPKDGNDYTTLLEHADEALYRVKEKGKNSFELYSMPEEG